MHYFSIVMILACVPLCRVWLQQDVKNKVLDLSAAVLYYIDRGPRLSWMEGRKSPMEPKGWRDEAEVKARKQAEQRLSKVEPKGRGKPGGAERMMVPGGAEGRRSHGGARLVARPKRSDGHRGPRWS